MVSSHKLIRDRIPQQARAQPAHRLSPHRRTLLLTRPPARPRHTADGTFPTTAFPSGQLAHVFRPGLPYNVLVAIEDLRNLPVPSESNLLTSCTTAAGPRLFPQGEVLSCAFNVQSPVLPPTSKSLADALAGRGFGVGRDLWPSRRARVAVLLAAGCTNDSHAPTAVGCKAEAVMLAAFALAQSKWCARGRRAIDRLMNRSPNLSSLADIYRDFCKSSVCQNDPPPYPTLPTHPHPRYIRLDDDLFVRPALLDTLLARYAGDARHAFGPYQCGERSGAMKCQIDFLEAHGGCVRFHTLLLNTFRSRRVRQCRAEYTIFGRGKLCDSCEISGQAAHSLTHGPAPRRFLSASWRCGGARREVQSAVGPITFPQCYAMFSVLSAATLSALRPALSLGMLRKISEASGLAEDTSLGVLLWAVGARENNALASAGGGAPFSFAFNSNCVLSALLARLRERFSCPALSDDCCCISARLSPSLLVAALEAAVLPVCLTGERPGGGDLVLRDNGNATCLFVHLPAAFVPQVIAQTVYEQVVPEPDGWAERIQKGEIFGDKPCVGTAGGGYGAGGGGGAAGAAGGEGLLPPLERMMGFAKTHEARGDDARGLHSLPPHRICNGPVTLTTPEQLPVRYFHTCRRRRATTSRTASASRTTCSPC